MNTSSTSQAGSPSQRQFSRQTSLNDPHFNPNTHIDPITHRPPGRLAYRDNPSPLQPSNSPLHFHPPTTSSSSSSSSASSSSHLMEHSADPPRAVPDNNNYSPSSTYSAQFSHQSHHPFPVTPHSTPDTPSYQNPIRGAQAYDQDSLSMWYPQAYSHSIVSDSSPRGTAWAQGDAGGPTSNIPRIFINSQESTPSTTALSYPSSSAFFGSSSAPSPHAANPSRAPDPSAAHTSHASRRNPALHFGSDNRYNLMDAYAAAAASFPTPADQAANAPAPAQRAEARPPRPALSVPILKLDTTGLDHTASTSRNDYRAANLGASPRRGLTSPYETPSPNPPSASSNPSPNSSTSSSMPSPSPGSSSSPMTFVPFQPGLSAQAVHVISEDRSITESALREVFPPAAQCPPAAASPQSQPARKWICQWQGCGKSVRRQDRVAHALEHHGRKRFACSCGGSFARSQDKKRHLREQAICRHCPRSVGRNGYRGVCPTCSQDHHHHNNNNNNNNNDGGGGGGAPYSA